MDGNRSLEQAGLSLISSVILENVNVNLCSKYCGKLDGFENFNKAQYLEIAWIYHIIKLLANVTKSKSLENIWQHNFY